MKPQGNKLGRFLVMLFIMGSFGCAFQNAQNDEMENIKKDREKLERTYGQITGVYQGSIEVSGDYQYPIALTLYTQSEEVGKTSEGQTKTLPVLYGAMVSQQIEELYSPIIFHSEFNEIDNSLHLIPPKEISPNSVIYHSFDGAIAGNQLSGKVTLAQGVQGQFNLILQTRDLRMKPGLGKPELGTPIYSDLKKVFSDLSGVYCFRHEKKVFEIRFAHHEVQSKPILVGSIMERYQGPLTLTTISTRVGSYRNRDSLQFAGVNKLNSTFDGEIIRDGNGQIIKLEGLFSMMELTLVPMSASKLKGNETSCPAPI